MSRVVRRTLVVASSMAGLAVVCLLVVRILAPLWLARYADTWRAEIAAERQRQASRSRPVLRGRTLDDNAAPGYRDAMEAIDRVMQSPERRLYGVGLGQAVHRGPEPAAPDEVARLLHTHRGDIERLRLAVRCHRCDWEIDYSRGFEVLLQEPSILSARVLVNLVLLSAREQARTGDQPGAAELYLDLLQFGADFDSASSAMVKSGMVVCQVTLDELVSLVTRQDPRRLPLSDLDVELARLDRSLPSAVTAYRTERLIWGALAASGRRYDDMLNGAVGHGSVHSPSLFVVDRRQSGIRALLSERAVLAHAVWRIDGLLRSLEQAAGAAGFEEWARCETAVDAASRSWNPFVRAAAATAADVRNGHLDLRARYKLVQSAVRLEIRRLQEGRYPAEPSELPQDPWTAQARLRYRVSPDGTGYALWSVGMNGADDGGRAEKNADLVVERRPAAP